MVTVVTQLWREYVTVGRGRGGCSARKLVAEPFHYVIFGVNTGLVMHLSIKAGQNL